MLYPTNRITWGSDPEGFFKRDGRIVGSEKLLPEAGLNIYTKGKLVRDGIQFELNPSAGALRDLAGNIGALLTEANKLAKSAGAELCFDGLVEVSREELNSLAPTSQVLGCQPSMNVYGAAPINADPKEYLKRSSGGHLHLGFYDLNAHNNRVNAVPLFDIFVGNTAVLLDRDPGAAERRLNYGRAGECRMPNYGLEYRTPSNFWLRDYSLMSLVFGMANVAATIMLDYSAGKTVEWNWLVNNVDVALVAQAINNNDFKLAMENLNVLAPFIRENFPKQEFPLNAGNLDSFIKFANSVNNSGIAEYFPTETIVDRWAVGKFVEFDTFLASVV
jgi:hypothetical protein